MIPVLLYFSSFLLVAYFSKSLNNEHDRTRFQLVACFVLLFVFFGLRDLPVLNDTAHYYGHFYNLTKYTAFSEESIFHYNPHERFEYGYMVFLRFIGKYISSNPYAVILVSSLTVTVANFKLISKNTNEIALTTFFFLMVLISQYSTIRQSIAIALFYIAFHCLQNGRWVLYYVLVALAYMFHTSALILLFFPIFTVLRVSRRNIVLTLTICVVIAIAIYPVLGYLNYADSVYYTTNLAREKAPIAAIMDLTYIVLILSACYYMHKRLVVPFPHRLLVWAAVFSLCCRIISVPFLAFGRFNGYFMPYVLLLFIYMIDNQRIAPRFIGRICGLRGSRQWSRQCRQCGSHLSPVILCDRGVVYKVHHHSIV